MQKQTDNSTEISPEAGVALVKAEARLAAAHYPVRNWSYAQAIFDARLHPDDSAGSWGKGAGDRERKQLQRACSELVKAGLIVRTRRTFGRKLTPAGCRWVRARTWPFSAELLSAALERIRERAAAGDCHADGFVPEPFVCGHAWGGDMGPFFDLEYLLLPTLIDGFVRSLSTMRGHVSYALSGAGPIGAIVVQSVGDEFDVDLELGRMYADELHERRTQILHDRRTFTELGEIPLPVGVSVQSDRSYTDLTGISPLFPAASSGNTFEETAND